MREKWGYKRRSNEVQEKNYDIFIILKGLYRASIVCILYNVYNIHIFRFIYTVQRVSEKTFPAVKSELWIIASIIGTAKIKTILTDYDPILYMYVQIFDSKHQKCILFVFCCLPVGSQIISDKTNYNKVNPICINIRFQYFDL